MWYGSQWLNYVPNNVGVNVRPSTIYNTHAALIAINGLKMNAETMKIRGLIIRIKQHLQACDRHVQNIIGLRGLIFMPRLR